MELGGGLARQDAEKRGQFQCALDRWTDGSRLPLMIDSGVLGGEL